MNEILTIILKAIVTLAVFYLSTLAGRYINAKAEEKEDSMLEKVVTEFVVSAQQLLGSETGEKRKEYVVQNLIGLGIELTDKVNALIESKVFLLHNK